MSDAASNLRINHMLRNARKRAGKSLDEVAKFLGITAASLSRMETGGSGVSADRLDTLAKFYRISIAALFEGQLVTMPSTIDLERMHGVVLLVHDVIARLRVKPSPQKIAETVTQVYRNEIERLLADPDADTQFEPDLHQGFVEMIFRR